MPPIQCCVPNCSGSKAVKHRFPDPKKYCTAFHEWIKIIGNENLKKKTENQIYTSNRVCSLHFEAPGCFDVHGKLRKGGFVRPTILLPNEQQFSETENSENVEVMEELNNNTIESSTLIEQENYEQCENEETASMQKTTGAVLGDLGVKRLNALCPESQVLYKTITFMKKRISTLKKRRMVYRRKMQQAKQDACNQKVKKSASLKEKIKARFFQCQMENCGKAPKGRRYTVDDKLLALAFQKSDNSGYKFWGNYFTIPCRKTLARLLNRIPIRPGLHKPIFTVIKAEIKSFKNILDKNCILLFDEMSIHPNLCPNMKEGTIIGFEDFGYKRTSNIANHVQVFMLKGIGRNWKQPVYFNFIQSATKKIDLVNIIKLVIKECVKIGLNIVATICDQGPNNRAAINYLIARTKEDYLKRSLEYRGHFFEVDNKVIIPLYDVPHIFKGIRNSLLKYNLKFKDERGVNYIAKWEHIVTAFKMDPFWGGVRTMPKLTESHVNPAHINKMKVSKCTQVFSHSVAVGVTLFACSDISVNIGNETLKLEEEAKGTADLLEFLDSLFDSLNGSAFSAFDGKELRTAVKKNSKHHKFWDEALVKLQTFYFIRNGQDFRPPSLLNLIRTLENFKILHKSLQNLGFDYMMPRSFNQDPLENFFGKIRQKGRRNINPTANDFYSYYKTLIVSGLTSRHSVGANCEDDDPEESETFLSLRRLVTQGLPEDDDDKIETKFTEVPKIVPGSISKVESWALSYVAGYLGKKFKNFDNDCSCRKQIFKENDQKYENEIFIELKEYSSNKHRLKYMDQAFINKIRETLKIIKYIFIHDFHKPGVLQYVFEVLKERIAFTDCIHDDVIKENVLNRFILVQTGNYCKQLNLILKGENRGTFPAMVPQIFKNARSMYISHSKRPKK